MATQPQHFLNIIYDHLGPAKVVIVFTEWNAAINEELIAGAKRIFSQYPTVSVECLAVPGAVELGFAIKQLSLQDAADAYIAFACVIRGGTPHFDYVCQAANDSIVLLNQTQNSPVIFGVLTLETEAQAWERLGGIHGHKGEEAAQTALSMLALKQSNFKTKPLE